MPRTIKLATATLALLLTASIVAIIAYDRGKASPHARVLTYNLNLDAHAAANTGKVSSDLTVQPEASRYRVHTTAKTAFDLLELRRLKRHRVRTTLEPRGSHYMSSLSMRGSHRRAGSDAVRGPPGRSSDGDNDLAACATLS